MTSKTEGIIMYHNPPGSYRPIMNCVTMVVIHPALCLLIVEWLHQSIPVSIVVEMNNCVAAMNQWASGNFCTGEDCWLFRDCTWMCYGDSLVHSALCVYNRQILHESGVNLLIWLSARQLSLLYPKSIYLYITNVLLKLTTSVPHFCKDHFPWQPLKDVSNGHLQEESLWKIAKGCHHTKP